MENATRAYKNKATNVLNQIYGYKNGNPKKFTASIFDGCLTEIAVDNRKHKLIMECEK